MLIISHYVFLLVRIEAVVDFGVLGYLSIRRTPGQIRISSVFHALIDIEEVDDLVLEDLALLALPEIRCQHADGVLSGHGELDLVLTTTLTVPLLIGCQLRGGLRQVARSSHLAGKLGWSSGLGVG